jgi:Dolichyl-phosphate-mannose-protein mannosyltransferase
MTLASLDAARSSGRAPACVAAGMVLSLLLAQLWLAGRVGLTTDEAHYALYGLHLDWSYFDHPPLVGWLQALVLPWSTSELALRLWPMALGALSAALLFGLARRLFPDDSPWVACVAVVLWAGAPIVHLTGLVMLPEDVLLPLALLVLHALVSVLRWGSLRQWLLLGAALGLAGLAKYTAVTLVVTVLGALLLAGRARDLRGTGPWLAAVLALALVSPVLLWNAAHDWASIRYQLLHGAGGSSYRLERVLTARGGELLLYGPALFVGGLLAGWQALRRGRAEPGTRLCLLTALPVLLLFWPASGRETTLPHWTQLAWAVLAVLAARWFTGGWERRGRRVLALAGGAWCGLLLLAPYALLGLRAGPPLIAGHSARAPFTGWDAAAATAVRLRDGLPTQPGPSPVLFTDRWTSASRLAWYGRPAPVQVIDRRSDQFDRWFGAPAEGARGVLVAWRDASREGDDEDLQRDLAHFARHELLEELPIEEHGQRIATFRFWACDGFRP